MIFKAAHLEYSDTCSDISQVQITKAVIKWRVLDWISVEILVQQVCTLALFCFSSLSLIDWSCFRNLEIKFQENLQKKSRTDTAKNYFGA